MTTLTPVSDIPVAPSRAALVLTRYRIALYAVLLLLAFALVLAGRRNDVAAAAKARAASVAPAQADDDRPLLLPDR